MKIQALPMSLDSLVGSLPDNIAMAARSRQRAFDAAAEGDTDSLRSQGMARPEDDLLNEALFEQGARVGRAPGLPSDRARGTLPLSLRGLSGVDYGYDPQGNPNAAIFRRR